MSDTGQDLELTDTEKAFIEVYLTNGRKAGAAYQAVKDNVSKGSADTLGSKMLKKVQKSSYYIQKNQEILNNYGLSMKKQIERLNAIYERSMEYKMKLEFDPIDKKMVPKVDEDGNMFFEYDSKGALGAIQEQNKMLGFHKNSKKSEDDEVLGLIKVVREEIK